jgi:hypothetical protein
LAQDLLFSRAAQLRWRATLPAIMRWADCERNVTIANFWSFTSQSALVRDPGLW